MPVCRGSKRNRSHTARPKVLATYHPSAILRARTEQDRKRQRAEVIKDLRRVAKNPLTAAWAYSDPVFGEARLVYDYETPSPA
jgi:glycerol-3-phosphate dehydrogenase